MIVRMVVRMVVRMRVEVEVEARRGGCDATMPEEKKPGLEHEPEPETAIEWEMESEMESEMEPGRGLRRLRHAPAIGLHPQSQRLKSFQSFQSLESVRPRARPCPMSHSQSVTTRHLGHFQGGPLGLQRAQ